MKGRKWYSLKKELRPLITGTSFLYMYNVCVNVYSCKCALICNYNLALIDLSFIAFVHVLIVL